MNIRKALPLKDVLRKGSILTAIALSGFIVYLHFTVYVSAGALWRDEANSFNLASLPSFGEIWHATGYDFGASAILRMWLAMGLQTDLQIRLFGFLVGLSVLLVLWIAGRRFGIHAPLLTLLLFAGNPLSIRYIDSIRPYGLGTLFILLTLIAMWNFLLSPSLRPVLIAAILSFISVQILSQNIVFLAIFYSSIVLLFVLNRQWKDLFHSLLIPVMMMGAFLFMLPQIKLNMADWGQIRQGSFPMGEFLGRIAEAVDYGNGYLRCLWIILLLLSIGMCIRQFGNQSLAVQDQKKGRQPFFFGSILMLTGIIYPVFLWILKVPTQPWYYLSFAAILALCIDVLIGSSPKMFLLKIAILCLVVCTTFQSSLNACKALSTDIDKSGTFLTKFVQKGDLVILNPWFLGASFTRYYHGAAVVVTIPQISDHRVHRYDLFKEQMTSPFPMKSIKEKIDSTIVEGHVIWFTGWFIDQPSMEETAPLLPAPNSPWGWSEAAYARNWEAQITSYLLRKTKQRTFIRFSADDQYAPMYETTFVVRMK